MVRSWIVNYVPAYHQTIHSISGKYEMKTDGQDIYVMNDEVDFLKYFLYQHPFSLF